MSSRRPFHVACLLLAALVLSLAPATAEDPESSFFPYEYHQETLDNGLKVVLIPMQSGGLLSYWTLVRTGARDEVEDGRTGFAHFFEHMMFRGTEKYPAEKFNEIITRIGANSNAYTTDDYTAYHLDIASADLETVMDLESDRFQNLSYSKAVFQTEAGAVYGEYRKNRASPFFTIYEANRQASFERHTYGHTAMGYVEDIQGMPDLFDYSLTFFDRFYRPDNSILLLVGDLDVASTMAMVKTYYGAWKSGYQAPDVPVEPPQTEEKRLDVAYEGATLPILWMSYKFEAFDPANKAMIAADLLCKLAFGGTSDLYQSLVLEEQKVQSLSATANSNRGPSLIDVYAQVKEVEDIDAVIAAVDQTIASFIAEPPPAEDLENLKKRERYGFLMRLSSASAMAGNLAPILAVSPDLATIDTYYSTLMQIQPADLQAAAKAYFDTKQRTVTVLKGAAQ